MASLPPYRVLPYAPNSLFLSVVYFNAFINQKVLQKVYLIYPHPFTPQCELYAHGGGLFRGELVQTHSSIRSGEDLNLLFVVYLSILCGDILISNKMSINLRCKFLPSSMVFIQAEIFPSNFGLPIS